MKKIFAILTALVMVFAVAAAAVAEESTEPTFNHGVQFNMDLDQVMGIVNLPNPEIDREKTRGTTELYELEYEGVTDSKGFAADIKYLFVANSLVAIHFDMADTVTYDTVLAELTETYGEAVPFDGANLGNGIYTIDDDGDLKDCKDMIVSDKLIIVLEEDKEGDVDVTFLDPTAAFINN